MNEYTQPARPGPRPPGPSSRGIPADLKEPRQFVCWRWVLRDGKWSKEPINPSYTGRRASVTNPLSWSTFDHAFAVCGMHPHLDGIGFVFTEGDPYCGIDFDGCVDDSGQIDPWAAAWIERLGGHAEFSPSLRGVHVIVRAKLAGGGRNNRARGVEIYDRQRFFTMTGFRMLDSGRPQDAQDEVDALLSELYPPRDEEKVRRLSAPVLGLTDDEVLEKARKAGNGRKFRKLHDEGDWAALGFPSQSEGDQAEMSLLLFWTGGDTDQVIRIFERSALYRQRGKGKDYARRTLDAILREGYRGGYYDPGYRDPKIVPTLKKVEALLEAPIWKGRRSPVARAVLTTFLREAIEHGREAGDGVVVSISTRKVAEESGTTPATVCNSALPELVRMKLVKWHSKGSGKRSSSFLLRVPRTYNTRNSHAYSVISTNVSQTERGQLSRLRGGWSRFAQMSRISKQCELPLVLILRSQGQSLTFSELVSLTGRSASSVGRSMGSLVGANLVVENERGSYRLNPDFWDRFDSVLRDSGVTKSESRQRARHEHERLVYAGWIQRWELGEESWVHKETGEVVSRTEALSRSEES